MPLMMVMNSTTEHDGGVDDDDVAASCEPINVARPSPLPRLPPLNSCEPINLDPPRRLQSCYGIDNSLFLQTWSKLLLKQD